MNEKIIDEVMGLVEKYGDECEQHGHGSGIATYQAILAKLREVLERKPLTDELIAKIELETLDRVAEKLATQHTWITSIAASQLVLALKDSHE